MNHERNYKAKDNQKACAALEADLEFSHCKAINLHNPSLRT